MIDLIPILLFCVILTVLAMEALLLFRYTHHNILQKTLMAIIVIWFVISIILVTNLTQIFYEGKVPQIPGVFNFFDIVISGIGIFSLLCYPIMVIQPRLISLRDSLLYLSPIISTIAIYLIWHAVTGNPLDFRHMSMDELRDNIYTVPVILRFLMVLFFTMYTVMILYNLWHLAPIYNKYSEDTYSDTAYNVKWVRGVVAAIGSMLVMNIILLFWKTVFTEILYTAVTVTLFIILTDNAVFRKVPEAEKIAVKWSFKGGWEKVEKTIKVSETSTEDNHFETLGMRLDQWMKEQKPFSNPEFSAKDVIKVFPELDYNTMTHILAQRKHTFQSYVRQHRIDEACRLMQKNPALKGCAISYNIGFSSPPSFTRAFVAVMGVSPVQFKETMINKG